MKHKKKIIILSIITLLAPGLLQYGFLNSKEAVKNKQLSHAESCCCGHDASTCQSCGCSDGSKEYDDNGRQPVTITSCGGSSDDMLTTQKINYFSTQSVFLNYLHVTTLAEAATLQLKDVLNKTPYKPPKPQRLTNFT